MTTKRTGGRILVDNLVAQGCDRIFTVPGESFLAVLDALHDVSQIEVVVCRQEGGVGFMACADGELTGRPGIAFVTRGPGATNASIGVHVAMQDSLPMILFVGDVGRGDRDREAFQEVDFGQMFGPLAKKVLRIDRAERIPEYVARAYATAMSGRPGPVVVVLPEDMLLDEAEALDRPHVSSAPQAPSAAELEELAGLIRAAQAPLAIVGGADWDAGSGIAFARWAEHMGIPVTAGFRRQDSIPNSSPAWCGNLGYGPNPKLVQRVKQADLLLVVGPRLGEATTDGYALITPDHPGQKLVHVHPDPEELNSVYRADLAICASMRTFTHALPEGAIFNAGKEAHAEWLDWSTPRPREGAKLDLGQCVLAMREAMPADTIICNGAGNFSGWWHRYWLYEGYGTQLAPTAGAMGYGVPAAVAAALRRPEQKVAAVAGDGDFLMNGQELATAVAQGCDMLVIVVDNGWYGTIRMHQEREYPGRISGTRLVNPDFAALARAYGAWSEAVESTDQFAPALARALEQKGVKLLHLKTDVEQISPAVTISQLRSR
ncbi:putative acetolactate synthase large subunit [Sphingomonas changbaiensis NBRC 104936]|uniref:Putative acetolactate synthase large subunit n=1 Tax=Sphingomonas changbaiensis NBRC 104936 TaxID=1219043 RepID=A0A0E9MMN0_9SPHN|nr:thiamine pyrophosphate-binding protein [Sphingomonas changbaiensis]GAO38799.1 putative acetolactate synthase large subunit [Sphingomonas changbaiensis NBRC 104936]